MALALSVCFAEIDRIMYDVNCPYCSAELEICHDEGYGYDEDVLHEQECMYCEKIFAYSTSIIFSYEAFKADCLNGGKHNWKLSSIYPNHWPNAKDCKDCGLHVRGDFYATPPDNRWLKNED